MRAGDIALAIFAVVLFPALFILMAVLPEHGIVIWLAVALVLAGFLLASYAGTSWQCPSCGHVFDIDPRTDLTSPHYPGGKRLRCPQCGKTDWAKPVKQARGPGDQEGTGTPDSTRPG